MLTDRTTIDVTPFLRVQCLRPILRTRIWWIWVEWLRMQWKRHLNHPNHLNQNRRWKWLRLIQAYNRSKNLQTNNMILQITKILCVPVSNFSSNSKQRQKKNQKNRNLWSKRSIQATCSRMILQRLQHLKSNHRDLIHRPRDLLKAIVTLLMR